jgi:class 3 adenylate cyclase
MRLINLLELGDIEGVDHEMGLYVRGAATLREPNYLRYAMVRRAMRLLLAGRFDEIEPLLERYSPASSRHELEPNTVQAFGVVLFSLRRLQGRVREVEEAFKRFVAQYPAVPAWGVALALLHVESGREDEARAELAALAANDFERLPQDANWVTALCVTAEVIARLGDRELAEQVYPKLLPMARRNVVVGGGWVCYGSVSRYLGLLSDTLGRLEEAEQHFEVALEMNTLLHAPPLVAYTSCEFAYTLAERGGAENLKRANELIGDALEIGGDLGMASLVERALSLRLRLQGIDSADVTTSLDAVASEVEEERPDLRGHTAPDGTVTILFSDIERSTELNERLGDRAFFELLREHNTIVRDQVRAHGGFEVKSQGDGFMIVFSEPRNGVECAVAIQRALAARDANGEPIRVRMGLHTGEAIRERDDFFGRNVVVAARIAAKAEGGEILVSGPLRELAGGSPDIFFGAPRELGLKGLTGRYLVHRVEWDLAPAEA